MTPILKNYAIINLIKELDINTIIVTGSKIGTVNHTIMTYDMCKNLKISVKGLIINNFDSTGYPISELKRDLNELTNLPVLCSLPHLTKFNLNDFSEMIENQVDISTLIN